MTIKKTLKITLLISTFLIVFLFGCTVIYVFYHFNKSSNIFLVLLYVLFITGTLSLLYHFKTLKVYFATCNSISKYIKALWVCNMLFSGLLFFVMLYMLYMIFVHIYTASAAITLEDIVSCIVLLVMLCHSVISSIEASTFFKTVAHLHNKPIVESIDDIVGLKDEENFNI